LKIHIKNQTGYKIDLCCGLAQELNLQPGQEATLEVQDEDFIYIDQIAQPNGEEDEDWTEDWDEEAQHDD
jgi:antitoxin component of MazEF toxin-antitoxin module